MKTAIFAYSRKGCETARKIAALCDASQTECFAPERLENEGFAPVGKPSRAFYGKLFGERDALIFVGSCGIAVREIAPHVKDKRLDPAVLCVDELGHFVIPVLSGHIGGANALASRIAEKLGAVAVITTATDINRKFSVDAWAAENGFVIGSMRCAKAVSAAILERDIPLYCALPMVSGYPRGTVAGQSGSLGISVGWETRDLFADTLHLIPKVLHVGIGCRKGTPKEAIAQAVENTFSENGIDLRAVACAASIDLKAEEAGLLAYCAEKNWPIRFYSAEELQEAKGDFTPSAFVQSVTGVDNVCERSAVMGADRLIVRKTAGNGVTVAVAAEKLEVSFG